MASAPFWIALICQIVIVVGYFWFYRKEQLCTFTIRCVDDTALTYFYSTSMISFMVSMLRQCASFSCFVFGTHSSESSACYHCLVWKLWAPWTLFATISTDL
jgi:hypothetical protein